MNVALPANGRRVTQNLSDRRVAKIVSKLQDLAGQDLFQYVDDAGEVRDITSQDVNEYLREITGEDFSAKDFRTWAGTILTAIALNAQEKFETKKQAKSNINTAIKAVAGILGNTPAICRKCYVHPAIFENYLDQKSIDGLQQMTEQALEKDDVDLRSSEKAVLRFLEARLSKKAA